MTWTTITSFVDRETGEAITQRHIDKKLYVKIKLNTKTKINNKDYGIKYNTWECEPNRQTKLEL